MNSLTHKLRTMNKERQFYTLHRLITQCIQADELERVQQLLTSFEFIEAKIEILHSEDGVNQLLADYTSAIAAQADTQGILASLETAIRLSTLILAEEAKQTFPQISSRLLNEPTPALRTLLDNYKPSYPWLRLWSKTMFSAKSPLLHTFVGPDAEVLDCALSGDASIALCALDDHTLGIWNLETGLCEQVLRGHTDAVNSCAMSADGRLALSASTDTTMRFWDVKTGQCLEVFEGHTHKVTGCALSADGSFFVSSSYDHTVRLWNRQTRTCAILRGHEERVTCCALSADGRFALSGSYDQTLRLWDVATHECLRILKDPVGGITRCALNYDGRFAVSTSIAYLLEWEEYDPTTEALPLTLFYNPEEKDAEALQTAPEDHFFHDATTVLENAGITGDILERETLIALWDTSSGTCVRELKGHQGAIEDIDMSRNGTRLISSSVNSGDIKIWDAETGENIPTFFEAIVGVSNCALDSSGHTALSSAQDGHLYVWSIPLAMSNAGMMAEERGGKDIICCQYDQAGDLALSLSSGKEIQYWNAQTGELLSHANATELPLMVGMAAVSANGQRVLVAPSAMGYTRQETQELKVFDIHAMQQIQTLAGHTSMVSACALDEEGKIALSASNDGVLRLWDIEAATCRFLLEGHTNAVDCCALSRDGLNALSGSDDTMLRVWDTQTGRCLHILQEHTGSIKNCVFSADGRRGFSVGADNMLCLWDLVSGILLHKHPSTREVSDPCALNTNGQVALYITSRRTIHVMKTETGQEIATFTFDAGVNALAFSPQGQDIMAGDVSGRVHFLRIEAEAS